MLINGGISFSSTLAILNGFPAVDSQFIIKLADTLNRLELW